MQDTDTVAEILTFKNESKKDAWEKPELSIVLIFLFKFFIRFFVVLNNWIKSNYRTRAIAAIIIRFWFETALDYKPRILGPNFLD